ncbi:MAG: hypothetical protein OXR73_17840 [Myxococcales bacterium]|nr:hypothetical protein [Myxococcales bacterium]
MSTTPHTSTSSLAHRGVALLLLLFAGCGAGFHQAAPRDPSRPNQAPLISHREVAEAFELRAQLPKPYRLGIYFREPDGGAPWRWQQPHRGQLAAFADELAEDELEDELGAVFVVGRGTASSDTLSAIRVAAARHGADAVLVVSGSADVRRGSNPLAVTYLALAPLLFAPGSELSLTYRAHAEMWDVRNGYLYLSAETESEIEQLRPLAFIDEEEAAADGQEAAVDALVAQLRTQLVGLH